VGVGARVVGGDVAGGGLRVVNAGCVGVGGAGQERVVRRVVVVPCALQPLVVFEQLVLGHSVVEDDPPDDSGNTVQSMLQLETVRGARQVVVGLPEPPPPPPPAPPPVSVPTMIQPVPWH
jgi:hypothetical protein